MSFDSLNDQVKSRKQNDEEVFEQAFTDLASILNRKNVANFPTQAKGAISEILSSLEASIPEIPDTITDLNLQLQYMLRPSATMKRRVELSGRWWTQATGRFLGSTIDGEVIAILPSKISGYEYRHPQSGKMVGLNKTTNKNIHPDAFCFYRALPAKKLSIVDLVILMLRSITGGDILFVLGATLLVSLTGLFFPFMNKQIFDSVIPSGIKSEILPVAFLLAGVTIGSTLFGITRSMVLARFRDKINISVQSAAMMRVFSLPVAFFKNFTAGELSTRVMSINNLCSMLSDAVMTTGLSALFSFVYIFQMGQYAPQLVVPGVLVIFLMLGFSILTALMQLGMARKRLRISAKLSGMLYALLSGIQKIKLAGAEKRAFSKWVSYYKEQGKLTYSPPFFLKVNSSISLLLTMGGSLILTYFAGATKISPADYLAFLVAYGSVSGAIMALGSIASTFARIKPLLEMVQPILETVPENHGQKKIVTALAGNIEVNHVTFRYDKDLPCILDDLSLKIKSGEFVGVVGRTGSGKSTLLRILLGFEKPETGAVYYDGQDLENLDLCSMRQCMGVDLQNGKLFAGDIFSNIIITAPWKTLADAWEAARLAGVEEDIRAMPMEMHTILSEGGGGISGGQRQRLLIARTLVSNPKILFFDEATSALDNLTQKHVAESIAGLRCTRLIIAHRLSTIQHCDRIIVLEAGKIAEEGSYKMLMEKKGIFYDLVKRQTI